MFMEKAFKKTLTPEESAAAKKVIDTALNEKRQRQDKEKAEHAEAERVRKLLQQQEAEKRGPYIISEEDIKEAEKTVGQKFEIKE